MNYKTNYIYYVSVIETYLIPYNPALKLKGEMHEF